MIGAGVGVGLILSLTSRGVADLRRVGRPMEEKARENEGRGKGGMPEGERTVNVKGAGRGMLISDG
jgi:hypothetical protein